MPPPPSNRNISIECCIERAVRFDEQCVLIPESSRPRKGLLIRPRLASKSFTLPIWTTTATTSSQETPTKEYDRDRGRKLTIALPSFGQAKNSPVTEIRPLPPCLRSPDREGSRHPRRSSSSPHSHHGRRPRSTSMPVTTLPLRRCCEACIPAVEAYLASPTNPEPMTKGAKRLMRFSRTDSRPECHVMVDEVEMRRPYNIIITEASDPEKLSILSGESSQPLSLGGCIYDDADECELFPLPSPSPKSSPRESPFASPAGSQTNLANPVTPTPIIRGNSPLSVSCFEDVIKAQETTADFLRNEVSSLSLTPSSSAKSPGSSPTSPKPRRPSLGSLSTSISKGSLAVVKGLSGLAGASMTT